MVEELNYESIGLRIRAARKDANLTQEKLAEALELSIAHVSGMENGKTGMAVQTVVKLANVLHVSTDWLLQDNLENYHINFETEIKSILTDCDEERKKTLLALLKSNRKTLDEISEDK